MEENKNLHFKTNIQLKSIIGKDLINDDNIAILELVKNSFDADAKKVEVQYFNLKNNDDKKVLSFSDLTSRLIIKDTGVGMNLDDIQNKWLNIAYSEKKTNNRQHNRMMAGAKGVGRFSCDRLGEYLNLYTKKKNTNHYLLLKIDWKKFEIDDNTAEIQSIELELETLSKEDLILRNIEAFEHGVLLEIIKLRSNWVYEIKDSKGTYWNTDKLTELKKYLEKLINPNQAFENNDFGIYLDAPEFIVENIAKDSSDKFIGKVENTIFDKLDFKATSIESRIIDNGTVIYTELKDKGQTVFWIKEKNVFFPEIKDIKVILYYLNPYTKAFFTKQMGIRSVDYGSIYVFLNGFRVPPYGESGDDWLNLEQRKSQGYNRFLSQRELVGRIEILDHENAFKVISSREGIVKNESYKKLTETKAGYFFKIFRRLEKYVVDGLDWDSIPEEDRNKISEIEKKIISGETNEDDLKYREDDVTKKRRVYESIHSIIAAKADSVIELYINENLILDKINEERLNAEREFEQLISDFENKKIDGDILNRILQRKATTNKDLEKQINDLSRYNTSDATTKAIAELQSYKEIIESQTSIIEDLKRQLENIKLQKEEAEKTADSYKEKVTKAERDLSIEKEKNLYLLATRRTLSPDADGLIHTIKINNIDIRDGIENIIDDLTENDFEIQDLIKRLGFLKISAERSLKMAEFVTRADLKEDIETKEVDIVKYIDEYIELYGDTFSDKLKFNFVTNGAHLIKNLSVLNMSIIIDNLLSNSVKWGANIIKLEFEKINNRQMVLYISDNGKGLSDKFEPDPKRIFELSVRDIPPTGLSGSGIGLYYTKNLLNEMGSEIEFIGNNISLSGATFKITFNSL
ncbi:ATP-binding protein [Flavobacterium qiangtangense]|uniref:ATP-binding protein n=1 Tax=Flavobacterium qiangtangense TaxID=1442595 RepID=A0ABW1PKT9_9FLAO